MKFATIACPQKAEKEVLAFRSKLVKQSFAETFFRFAKTKSLFFFLSKVSSVENTSTRAIMRHLKKFSRYVKFENIFKKYERYIKFKTYVHKQKVSIEKSKCGQQNQDKSFLSLILAKTLAKTETKITFSVFCGHSNDGYDDIATM